MRSSLRPHLMLSMTPDDLLSLQQLAIEHLQREFPAPLSRCEIHLTSDHALAIECFQPQLLMEAKDYLGILQYAAWQITGALEIHAYLQDSCEFQIETRREIAKTWTEVLKFGDSLKHECAIMLNATIEAPTRKIIRSSNPGTTAAVQNLVTLQDVEAKLSQSTGWTIVKTREAIRASGAAMFRVGDQMMMAADAGLEIFKQWRAGVEESLMRDSPVTATPTEQTPTPKAAIADEPIAEANAATNGRKRVRKSAPSAGVERAPVVSLSKLIINFSSYKKTAQAILEILAPGDLGKQKQMALAFAEGSPSTTTYLSKIVKLYADKEKPEKVVRERLPKAFAELAAEEPAETKIEAT